MPEIRAAKWRNFIHQRIDAEKTGIILQMGWAESENQGQKTLAGGRARSKL
jgi:hypothetical protein